MEESRFAFIIHPSNQSHFVSLAHRTREFNQSFLSSISNDWNSLHLTSSHMLGLPLVLEGGSKRTVCDVILCPLLPEQMVKDETQAVSMILSAISLAKKRGAQLVGLGGFTSIVGNSGLNIAARSSLPVTSGNTYTASTVVQGIVDIGEALNINFSNSCIAIIGATGDIGSACTQSLANLFGKIILVARNDERLETLAGFLRSKRAIVSIMKRTAEAAATADVIITATSALTTLIDAKNLKTNAIVCDVSYPANIAKEILLEERPDVLAFEGGIVSSKHFLDQIDPNNLFWEFNPRGGMHACFAETLLLTLEERFTTYSIGRGNILPEKMHEVNTIASKYRFYPLLPLDNIRLGRASGVPKVEKQHYK